MASLLPLNRLSVSLKHVHVSSLTSPRKPSSPNGDVIKQTIIRKYCIFWRSLQLSCHRCGIRQMQKSTSLLLKLVSKHQRVSHCFKTKPSLVWFSSRRYLCARKSPYVPHPVSLRSFLNVAFETVPMFVWLTMAISRQTVQRLSHPCHQWCDVIDFVPECCVSSLEHGLKCFA